MARTILMVPGVHFREIDISQYVRDLSTTKLAIVGPAQKGEFDTDLLITSENQLIDTLGVPSERFPGLLVAREYFEAGGNVLHYVRVGVNAVRASVTVPLIDGTNSAIQAKELGTFFNNLTPQISYGSQSTTEFSVAHDFASGANDYDFELDDNPLVPGTVVVKFGTTKVAEDDGSGALTFLAGYTDYTGTVDYETGEMNISTTALGADNDTTVNVTAAYWATFTIQVKYQARNSSGDPIGNLRVLESFPQLTVFNMIERLSESQYIEIPDDIEFSSFPVSGPYALTGGDDGIDDLTDADYIGNLLDTPTGMQIFGFPDQVDINILMVPDASESLAIRQAMFELVEVKRADTLAVLDPPAGLTVEGVCNWADGQGAFSTYDTIDSTYEAIYFPHYTTQNPITSEKELTPPSAAFAAAVARSYAWEAPAGPERGKLINIVDIERKLSPGDRAILADHRINPISDLNGISTMILGQQTATLTASSLDRVADRLTVMMIEKAVTTALYPLLFLANTPRQWNRAGMIIDPYLEELVNQEKILDGKFFCNRDTNTDQNIQNSEMVAVCQITPLRYAEIIIVNFLITKVGAQITENIISQAAKG
jgi:hypothetical protein